MNATDVDSLVARELASIVDESRLHALGTILVPPERERRVWNYAPGVQHECWRVACVGAWEIVYCSRGFGPDYPWGFISARSDDLGSDDHWHASLEHAAIAAGVLPAPPGYEVP